MSKSICFFSPHVTIVPTGRYHKSARRFLLACAVNWLRLQYAVIKWVFINTLIAAIQSYSFRKGDPVVRSVSKVRLLLEKS